MILYSIIMKIKGVPYVLEPIWHGYRCKNCGEPIYPKGGKRTAQCTGCGKTAKTVWMTPKEFYQRKSISPIVIWGGYP